MKFCPTNLGECNGEACLQIADHPLTMSTGVHLKDRLSDFCQVRHKKVYIQVHGLTFKWDHLYVHCIHMRLFCCLHVTTCPLY